MHILMIAPEQIPVPPPRGGSVEICMLAIARQWAKSHRVTIVSRSARGYPSAESRGRLTIVRVPSGSPSVYIANVCRRIAGHHFDWIQIDNRPRFVPKIKALFPHVPVSLYLHSLTFVSPSGISREKATACMARADRIVGNSLSLKRELISRFPSLRHKISYVHLGVDVSRFRPASDSERSRLRRRYGLNGRFAVLYAGRIIPRKGVDVLIRGVHKLRKNHPSAAMIVAGGDSSGGAYTAGLKRLSARLRVPAVFLGRQPHTRMHNIYRMADCFVCPSQRHEAFGLVNVEAMASGVPVVASKIGGIGEIVKHGRNGIMVTRYRSPDAFAGALRLLAGNRTLASRLGHKARADAIARFGWSRTAAQLLDIYRRSR